MNKHETYKWVMELCWECYFWKHDKRFNGCGAPLEHFLTKENCFIPSGAVFVKDEDAERMG